ncbi:hepatocyte growth factor activator isoform X1 [Eschrichtius robustus]|uniref:hepatocyte growth factor activator isoform X1 n=1 Tax=Eschrichtius robustus TaxID=9764 RepID=UPI0035C1E732
MGRWAGVPGPCPPLGLSLLLLLLLVPRGAQPQAGRNQTEPPEYNATVTPGTPAIPVTSVTPRTPATATAPKAEGPHGGGLIHLPRAAPSNSSPGDTVLTEAGQPCRFPFRYGGRMVHSCTTEGSAHRKWCATTHNYDRDRAWGYCVQASAPREGPAAPDPCASGPCLNGGSCSSTQDPESYHCTCPVAFTGKDCGTEKCFDESRYEYLEVGDRWARVHRGRVEQCECVGGQVRCQGTRHTGTGGGGAGRMAGPPTRGRGSSRATQRRAPGGNQALPLPLEAQLLSPPPSLSEQPLLERGHLSPDHGHRDHRVRLPPRPRRAALQHCAGPALLRGERHRVPRCGQHGGLGPQLLGLELRPALPGAARGLRGRRGPPRPGAPRLLPEPGQGREALVLRGEGQRALLGVLPPGSLRIPCQNSAPAHRGPAEPAWARGSWTSRTPDLWQEAQEEELPTATHHRRLVLAARLPPLAGRHLHREQLLCREPCPYLLGGVCRPLLLQQPPQGKCLCGPGPTLLQPHDGRDADVPHREVHPVPPVLSVQPQ